MRAILEIQSGPEVSRRIAVSADTPRTIGQSMAADERFADDAWMSPVHAALWIERDTLHVRDLDNVALAPDSAVQRGPNGLYVWLVGSDDTVTIRDIKVQTQGEGRVVVASGLAEGDRVVIAGQARLYDHAKVAISDARREAALSAAGAQ